MVPEPATPRRRVGDLVDVVDQDVELSLVRPHALKKRGDLRVVAVIGLYSNAMPAGLVDERSGAVDGQLACARAAAGDVDRGTLLAECNRSPAPDPPAGAGDDRNLAAESCSFDCRVGHHAPAAGTKSTSRRVRPRKRKLGKYSNLLDSASVKLSRRRTSSSKATLPSSRDSAAPRQK